MEEIKRIWQSIGRPSSGTKLATVAKKEGRSITIKAATDFIKGQSTTQVFAPPPKSDGKITSPEENARWQVDLLDMKAKDPEKNKNHKMILIAVDIFSRKMYTEPLKSKEPAEVASAFQLILNRGQGRIKGKTSHGVVREVTTDHGQEFKGAFTELLESRGIAHTFKESLNTLAICDSATRTLKSMLAKQMTEEGRPSC